MLVLSKLPRLFVPMTIKKKKKKTKTNKEDSCLSDSADRHDLYERSVQCAESEVDFVDQQYLALRKRKAIKLREDFCGTAQVSFEWIKRRRENIAIGVDNDSKVIAWGISRHMSQLKSSRKNRVTLRKGNVLDVKTDPQDVVLATNFSYWCFKERNKLLHYFENVLDNLVEDGIFFLDCYGGYDAYRPLKESTEHDDFTYIWEQADFNPVNSHTLCHIHFEFPDGSKLERAFSYSWRIWTLPEIREILLQAGFSQSLVFWQGWDEEEKEGSGEFDIVEKADPDAGWIAYVAAMK